MLKGFESTVFAYGQTGTGKTYTMEGELNTPEQQGVIPRAAHEIFNSLKQPHYKEASVTCSYLEIYNEELCDLLADLDERGCGKNSAGEGGKRSVTKLEIMEGKNGTFCRGLSEKNVFSADDVLQLMQNAQQQRHIGETKMNKHSSRSHCIFTIRVHSNSILPDGGGTMEFHGKLHMVDLAGSECARTASFDRPNSMDAARERERMNINRSLLTLGRVISLLKESGESKKSNIRIPYRDSKLTRILQESLGGRCKTVIIATLSPSITAIEESTSTLSYAQSALGIVNKPVSASLLSLHPGQAFPHPPSEGDNGVNVNAVEYWHEMECRLQYMQAQVEESQAALARKHLQQQELVERAERAVSERLEVQMKLVNAKEEIIALNSQINEEAEKRREAQIKLDETRIELQKTVLVLNATRETERRLTNEAKLLMNTLELSIADGDSLHNLVKDMFDAEILKRDATKAFHSASSTLLKDSLVLLQQLSLMLENHCSAVTITAADLRENAQTSSVAVADILSSLTDQMHTLADAMTKQVSGEEGLLSVASRISSKVLYSLQTATSCLQQGENELFSSCFSAKERLQEVSNQLINLKGAHEHQRDKSISSLATAADALKAKLSAAIKVMEEAIFDAEVKKNSAHTELRESLSRWRQDVSDTCGNISEKTNYYSEGLLHATETFNDERQHRNRVQRELNEQHEFLSKTRSDHMLKISHQKSLLLSNEATFQQAQKECEQLRISCIQGIMNKVNEIVNTQMQQFSHATERQFQSLREASTELKKSNAVIGDCAQNIFLKIGDSNAFVSQEMDNLQKSDSVLLQEMYGVNSGLKNVIELTEHQSASSNTLATKAISGLDHLAGLDQIAIENLRSVYDGGRESLLMIENSLYPETVDAMRSVHKSGENIVQVSFDSAIHPTLKAIDSIMQPRKAILSSMEREQNNIKEMLDSQSHMFTHIAEEIKSSREDALKNNMLLISNYRNGAGKECLDKVKLLEKNLHDAASNVATGRSDLLGSAASKTKSVKTKITEYSCVTMKMDEDSCKLPEKLRFDYNQTLSHTPSEEEIIMGSRPTPLSNIEPDMAVDLTTPRDNDDRQIDGKENISDTASVKSGDSDPNGTYNPDGRMVSNKFVDIVGSRVFKDVSSSSNKRQISRSCAKRPHLSRNTGTPQRLDRKKVKYTCSPSRGTPNSKLK